MRGPLLLLFILTCHISSFADLITAEAAMKIGDFARAHAEILAYSGDGDPLFEKMKVHALVGMHRFDEAIAAWESSSEQSLDLLEAIAFGRLQSNLSSPHHHLKANALIGIASTHRVEAVLAIERGLLDPHPQMRHLAASLARSYGDQCLIRQMNGQLLTESSHEVRIALMRALMEHRAHLAAENIAHCLSRPIASPEEKGVALEALDALSIPLTYEGKESSSSVRLIQCRLLKDIDKEKRQQFLEDDHVDVRINALYHGAFSQSPLWEWIEREGHPLVKAIAGWCYGWRYPQQGEEILLAMLEKDQAIVSPLSAYCLGKMGCDLPTGKRHIPLLSLNHALGGLGRDREAGEVIHQFLAHNPSRVMWHSIPGIPIRWVMPCSPSSHTVGKDRDQAVRLDLIHALVALQSPYALGHILNWLEGPSLLEKYEGSLLFKKAMGGEAMREQWLSMWDREGPLLHRFHMAILAACLMEDLHYLRDILPSFDRLSPQE
ncbi:MAG: hypothetical protein VXZ72_01945, partial [Chlamydiota bacterium]|nr:hypothetical protein [Chlamydiota bacterium]